MTTRNLPLDSIVEIEVWAECPDSMTLDEFEQYLRDDLGNPVIRVDREHSRILMAATSKDS